MFRSIVFLLFVMMTTINFPLVSTVQAAEAKTVILDVPGMTCKFCPITIRKSLQKISGVESVKSDFESKTATVTFDPDKTNVEQLMESTANAGYKSTIKK